MSVRLYRSETENVQKLLWPEADSLCGCYDRLAMEQAGWYGPVQLRVVDPVTSFTSSDTGKTADMPPAVFAIKNLFMALRELRAGLAVMDFGTVGIVELPNDGSP